MRIIRDLFSNARQIDRPIEKVIDYYATDSKRLAREIEEYEVTDNIEACFQRFLDVFGQGVRTGDVTEVGIWVWGFYGCGKSSFTKYLGFALNPIFVVEGTPFFELLCNRLKSHRTQAELRALVSQHPTTVIMLDLGAEQLADTASASVTTVLYWKVLQWARYSTEKKIAQLELKLEESGLYEAFQDAYRQAFPGKGEWKDIHNDPLIGISRADQLVPQFLPDDFPKRGDFRSLKFEQALTVRDQAEQMIRLIRRRSGNENILFLIDEAGQYVAPRSELILNLDGLARNLKELGGGRVWIAATGQQTLAEIVEKSAHNSTELNKLRDRFPISIGLDARDIREITYLRLLTKSAEGQQNLHDLFVRHGQAAVNFTRLTGTQLFKGDPDADTFVRFYPFLPHHFDLLMELIRTLAGSTGGIGLRSAIRVIQDLLVDASRSLPSGKTPLADRPLGTLAGADDFFDTLRADIGKGFPHVVLGVEKVQRVFDDDPFTIRVAKAIAALQPIENFPRTAENIAALLHPSLDSPGQLDAVRESLAKLVAEKECSVVEDPQAGGYVYLSEGIKVYRDDRNRYLPTMGEINQLRSELLARIFDPLPSAMLQNTKKVTAGLRFGRTPVVGEGEEIQIRIESTSPVAFEARRQELLIDTNTKREFEKTIALLVSLPDEIDELLVDAKRSDYILGSVPERDADKDVAQFLRSERTQLARSKEKAQKLLERAIFENGVFVFRGGPKPVREDSSSLEAACRKAVESAAKLVFHKFHLVPIRPATDLAAKFLEIERLDRMPADRDPLGLVGKSGAHYSVQVNQDALTEARRAFQEKLEGSGSGRLFGKAIQDEFSDAPYGWTKDATRYLFAALFRASEIQLHAGEGVVTTVGPKAVEAFRSTVAFNRVGISLRDSKPPLEALDRAAQRLEDLFALEVLPLEEHISRAVRTHIPSVIEEVSSLPDRLRLLNLQGKERAQTLLQTCADLLKEDASGATTVLGANDCPLPSDIVWARTILKSLSDEGESLIGKAQKLIASVSELRELFPIESQGLLPAGSYEAIADILSSKAFFERISDLRSTMTGVLGQIRQRYSSLVQQYREALQEALSELENTTDWLRLTPEDRAEIASRLMAADLPDEPRAEREVQDLQLLLTRQTGIPAQIQILRREVSLRIPKPVVEDEQTPEPDEPAMVTIEANDLEFPKAISSEAELEAWIQRLRTRLLTLLSEYATIRFGK